VERKRERQSECSKAIVKKFAAGKFMTAWIVEVTEVYPQAISSDIHKKYTQNIPREGPFTSKASITSITPHLRWNGRNRSFRTIRPLNRSSFVRFVRYAPPRKLLRSLNQC
jgi:hypothetical protein